MTEAETVRAVERAWPFVVTRNRVLDWRPIIAPEFMVKRGGYYLLTYESAGKEDGMPHERVISPEGFGDLTLMFRTTPATRRLLGEASDQALVDRDGRQIHVTTGLVLAGRHPGAVARWQDSLSEVAQMAAEAFPGFWVAEDEASARPIASQPVTGRRVVSPFASPTPPPLPALSRAARVVRRRAPVLIGVAATLAFILVYLLTRGHPD